MNGLNLWRQKGVTFVNGLNLWRLQMNFFSWEYPFYHKYTMFQLYENIIRETSFQIYHNISKVQAPPHTTSSVKTRGKEKKIRQLRTQPNQIVPRGFRLGPTFRSLFRFLFRWTQPEAGSRVWPGFDRSLTLFD